MGRSPWTAADALVRLAPALLCQCGLIDLRAAKLECVAHGIVSIMPDLLMPFVAEPAVHYPGSG